MALASLANREPTTRAEAIQGRSEPGKVTGKLKVALDAMVWIGLSRSEAATKAGLSEHSLYNALRKPHVRQHYLNELEVLRTSERAKNIHALADVRDGTNQMARVAAVKALEQLSEETQGRSGTSVSSPGLTIQIINAPGQSPSHSVLDLQDEPHAAISKG
jgi:hypothetical protein